MVEPGTVAIGVLSTIAGISGYGAMKLNSKRNELMEAEIAKRVKAVKDLLTATEEAKRAAEASLAERQSEIDRLNNELNEIRAAKERMEQQQQQQQPPPAAETTPPPAAETTPPPPAAETEPEAQDRTVSEEERRQCQATLDEFGIRSLRDWRRWALRNRDSPDRPRVSNCVDILLKGRTGGMRKSTLKNRRQTIQNGRRTRRGKNRADRTHPNSR